MIMIIIILMIKTTDNNDGHNDDDNVVIRCKKVLKLRFTVQLNLPSREHSL